MKRILLVDGTNVVMRFAYAIAPGFVDQHDAPELTRNLGRIFAGVHRAIVECAEHANASHAIIALDGGSLWRKRLYPEYKATRTVDTKFWQDRLRSELAVRGLRSIERHETYEADDVVATLAKRIASAGHTAAILSSDNDLLALASDVCDVYQFGRRDEPRYVHRSPDWIAQRFGLESLADIPVYKALVGESTDNLPGVDGIGPVKARRMIRTRTVQYLAGAERERFDLMLRLVTLSTDVPIDRLTLAECRVEALAS